MNLLISKVKFLVFILLIPYFFSGCYSDPQPTESDLGSYTVIEGSINGTLSADKSPYWVTHDLVVDSNSTLIINEGVIVYLSDSSKILVNGQLLCFGSQWSHILLLPFSESWNGIIIKSSSLASTFHFVEIQGVDATTIYDTTRNGALHISDADVTISNCIFKNNKSFSGGAVSLRRSNSLVTNNIFYNNLAAAYGGAILSSESSNKIINNTFYKNEGFNYGGALVLLSPVLDEVQNNIFYKNTCRGGDPRISYLQADSSHSLVQYNFMEVGYHSPSFLTETNLHLNNTSPCLKSGNPSSIYNNADGTRNDQGAYGGPLGDW